MGTKPTPTEVLKIRGSWRAKTRPNEPEPMHGIPDCPEWLTREARAEWDRQIVDLNARRLLAKSYRAALAMWCQAWGQYVEAVKDVEANGYSYTSDKGNEVQRPMVGVMHTAFANCLRLGQQFGFSPASQASIQTVEQTEKKNGKSRFFAS